MLCPSLNAGSGEQLMKTLLAKQAVDRLTKQEITRNELSALDALELCLNHDFLCESIILLFGLSKMLD